MKCACELPLRKESDSAESRFSYVNVHRYLCPVMQERAFHLAT